MNPKIYENEQMRETIISLLIYSTLSLNYCLLEDPVLK